MVPPLTSDEDAVMPTAVPLPAPSTMLVVAPFASLGTDGAASVTWIAKSWLLKAPLGSEAFTVMLWLVAKFSRLPFATVTTPVEASIANRPPASSLNVYVTAPPLTSDEDAVMPTAVPLPAPSTMLLVAPFASLGTDGAASVTWIVKSWLLKAPLGSEAFTVMLWLVAVS